METIDLNDTAAFVAVARALSFTQAGKRLGLPKGTVSRRVSALERRLGTRLLERTTRKLALTDVGRAYYERCLHAIEEIENAERLATDLTGHVRGTLRVSTAPDFGTAYLARWLPEFRALYPDLELVIDLNQRRVDLVAEGFDVVLRGGGPLIDSSLIARKIFSSDLALFASPAYLERRGTPLRISELRDHECVGMSGSHLPPRWRLEGPDGVHEIELSSSLRANEFGFLRAVVAAGFGIGLLEASIAVAYDAWAPLVRVLPDYAFRGGGLFAVYPSSHHLSPKVRVFVDFVAARLKAQGFGYARPDASP